MARIMIVSPSPLIPTGYGEQSAVYGKLLQSLGHEVSYYALCGMGAGIQYHGMPIYSGIPKDTNILSGLHLLSQIKQWDLVISFFDIFAFDAEVMDRYKWMAFLMVDAEPFISRNAPQLKSVDYPIAVTEWGRQTLKETWWCKGLESDYIPLLFDENEYYPDYDREWFEKIHNVKPERLFMTVAANTNDGGEERKNYPELIKWWCKHAKENTKDYLYLHTDYFGISSNGIHIVKLLQLYEASEDVISRVLYPPLPAYINGLMDKAYMRKMYSMADFMIVPSHSEGFGCPYVEAALCNCMPIGNDFGAAKEIIETCDGVTIDCVPSYFADGSQKSKSYAEDIERAVEEAISKKARNLNHTIGAKEYTINQNANKLQASITFTKKD